MSTFLSPLIREGPITDDSVSLSIPFVFTPIGVACANITSCLSLPIVELLGEPIAARGRVVSEQTGPNAPNSNPYLQRCRPSTLRCAGIAGSAELGSKSPPAEQWRYPLSQWKLNMAHRGLQGKEPRRRGRLDCATAIEERDSQSEGQ